MQSPRQCCTTVIRPDTSSDEPAPRPWLSLPLYTRPDSYQHMSHHLQNLRYCHASRGLRPGAAPLRQAAAVAHLFRVNECVEIGHEADGHYLLVLMAQPGHLSSGTAHSGLPTDATAPEAPFAGSSLAWGCQIVLNTERLSSGCE